MVVYLTPLGTAVGKDPSICDNYRQITLTPILSKVDELCSLIEYRLSFTNLPFLVQHICVAKSLIKNGCS